MSDRNYNYTGDWHDLKLIEQKELLSAEVDALRKTVAEQHASLTRIDNILAHELMNDAGKLHSILTHFYEPLTEIMQLVRKHLSDI
jgi:hypothetical protein